MIQRISDILFAGLAIFALSPVLVPVIILLRLTGEEKFSLPNRG